MGDFISLLVVILFYFLINLILYLVFEYFTGRLQRRDDKEQKEEDEDKSDDKNEN